ncbi:hypothetical protein KJ951_01225, partial [Patescibacteria group bacterium]|nr:hypothetical protein [Patescibacteria group bacterium]
VAGFDLAAESAGFLAGYLAVAESQLNKDQAEKYKSFLITHVGTLSDRLKYKAKVGDDERYDYDKGRFQIDALKSVLTPGEWLDKQKEAGDRFTSIQRRAEEVAKGLEFNFSDPWLRTFLGKSADDMTFGDTADMDKAEETINAQAAGKLKEYKDGLDGAHFRLSEKMAALEEKNKPLKHFSDEQIDVIKKQIDDAKEGIGKISVSPDDSFDEMVKSMEQIKTSLNYMESVSVRIGEMDKEIDETKRKMEEDERKKKEAQEAARKAAAAAGGGAGVGTVATATAGSSTGVGGEKTGVEIKEDVGEREKFVKEKNLDERLVGTDYHYSPGSPEYRVEDGCPALNFKNADVQKLVGDKLNRYFKGLGKRFFNDEISAKMSELMKKPDYNFGMVYDFIVANKDRMKPEVAMELGRLGKVMDLFSRALTESTMKFDTRPSAEDLESEYKKVFVPAWERAVIDFDDIVGDIGEKVVAAEHGEIPAELRFLGKSPYPEYEGALRKLAFHGDDPEGVEFNLPYAQGTWIYCGFKREAGGGYRLNYENGFLHFNSIEEAAKNINDGLFHRHYMDGVLKNDEVFERYEDEIGTLDKNEPGDMPRSRRMELDWTNPDAQVSVIAYPHGRIGYVVKRENVGPLGENFRIMFAESIPDFARQLAHLRKWAEGDEHGSRPGVESRKETLFDAITNPYT